MLLPPAECCAAAGPALAPAPAPALLVARVPGRNGCCRCTAAQGKTSSPVGGLEACGAASAAARPLRCCDAAAAAAARDSREEPESPGKLAPAAQLLKLALLRQPAPTLCSRCASGCPVGTNEVADGVAAVAAKSAAAATPRTPCSPSLLAASLRAVLPAGQAARGGERWARDRHWVFRGHLAFHARTCNPPHVRKPVMSNRRAGRAEGGGADPGRRWGA